MSILDQILEKKQAEIARLKSDFGDPFFIDKLKTLPSAETSFYDGLSASGLGLIAEIKKASPSKGIIRKEFDPVILAEEFMESGASALSVLTEKAHFMGSPVYIPLIKNRVDLPLLRKDFIVEPIQIYESRFLGADAILLIKALLDKEKLSELLEIATESGLDVLVEIHDESEWDEIKDLPIKIVGVNNRNLKTFKVDTSTAPRLLGKIRESNPDILVIAESGYSSVLDLKDLENEAFDGVLIGEGLAKNAKLLEYFKK